MSDEQKDSFANSLKNKGNDHADNNQSKDDFLKGLNGEREVMKVTSQLNK